MASDPTAAYRKQQGLAPITQSYDPIVVKWTQQAAAATGADPVVLLATAIQESGARRGAVGDNGSSFGPWQMHRGGALGSHSPAWANSYATALNRAKEFARLKVHGGVGAAAVQRPADRALYARGVESHLEQARAILGRQPALKATPATPGAAPQTKAAPAPALEGAAGLDAAGKQAFIQALYSDAPASDLASLVQQASETGARPAGGSRAVVSPAKAGAQPLKPATLTPGGGWAGSQGLATTLAKVGFANGLRVMSEKRDRRNTASGGVSDHWTGSKSSYAYDLSNGTKPTPQMDATAAQIAADLGALDQWKKQGSAGVLNVTRNGYRYQMLYRTDVGGNHYNHVHVGVRKV